MNLNLNLGAGQDVILNDEQQDLIVGTLLGDGNLQSFTKGKTWRYRALHSKAQKAYLLAKYKMLENLCGSEPAYGETFDPRTNRTYKRLYFNTVVWPCFKKYGDMFYTYDPNKGEDGGFDKHIPENIAQYLTPRAAAFFHMDDGSLKSLNESNAMRISTQGFPDGEIQRLIDAYKQNFNIDLKTLPRNNTRNGVKYYVGLIITVPEKSSAAYRELIRPYLIDSMKYKVSNGTKGHL